MTRIDGVRAGVWGGSLALALALMGCGTVGPVEAQGLPLRRVVIYRNGVGYFERAGHVDGERVDFHVRRNEVGDFLATLAVLERGGSSVRSASFPLAVAKDPPPPAPQPTRREYGFPPPAAPRASAGRSSDLETVVMSLDGREHDLEVGYIAVAPVWRPSYRLVLDDEGATLQAWGIVQNLSGEDWTNVSLSLIAEAPLAFDASLATAVIPPRPTVTDGGDVIAVVPQSVTSLAQAPPPPAPASVAMEDEVQTLQKESFAVGGAAPMAKSAPRGAGVAPMAMAAPAPAYSGRTKNLSALAAIALQAGATRYDLAAPVSIPDESATMVMLLDKPIPGEAISLFAPDDGVPESASHPFRVARFKNETGGLLERGPLAIFQHAGGGAVTAADAFLGQGMTDALPAGATATVPFALEKTLAVERTSEYREEGARVFKIEGAELQIARDTVTVTKYKVRNGAGRAAKLLVKHARVSGARLVSPPSGTEDNVGAGSALVPMSVDANATATLAVDERQPTIRGVDWLDPLADEAVRAYLAPANARADAAAARVLAAAWVVRKALVAANDERTSLATQQNDLQRGTEETRANLKALEKNTAAADLRAKLTSRLSADSARLDAVTKRIVEVDLVLAEQRVRLKDALRGLKVYVPTDG